MATPFTASPIVDATYSRSMTSSAGPEKKKQKRKAFKKTKNLNHVQAKK